jgi:hypothetical protein
MLHQLPGFASRHKLQAWVVALMLMSVSALSEETV